MEYLKMIKLSDVVPVIGLVNLTDRITDRTITRLDMLKDRELSPTRFLANQGLDFIYLTSISATNYWIFNL